MEKNKKELIEWCYSKLGTPYVYGAKGKILTQSQINQWAGQYPSTFTPSYIAKAKAFIGRSCTDCSGLISWYTGILRGSSQYKSTAVSTLPINQLSEQMIGWALWKQGHIGVYVGEGYCIEAKGINYGTVKTRVSATAWTHILKLCDIDYTEAIIKNGWVQDSRGWKYYQNNQMIKGWKMIDYVWYYLGGDGYMVASDWIKDNGNWYYLNANGSLYYGWLLYKNKWCYLSKDGSPEGAMATGFQKIKYQDQVNDYFFDKDGYMISVPITVIPDAKGALRVNTGTK